MNVKESMMGWLILSRSPGLYNRDMDCTCTVDNLIPCNLDCADCEVLPPKEDNIVQFKE